MPGKNKDFSAMISLASGPPKVGCVTCKIRRKKCDQRKPNCEACERNVLICVYRQNVISETGTGSQQQSAIDLPASPAKSTSQIFKLIRRCEDRHNSNPLRLLSLTRPESSLLHSHFLHRTAHMLSATATEGNPFVKILLPIAASSDMVLQAVLALSGVHFEAQRTANHVVATYEHFAQALRGLKYGLTKFVSGQNDLALELSLMTLLFCFIECIRGDIDGNAFRHLNAARQLFPVILHDAALITSQPETVSFLLEYYVYILSLSSLSLATNQDYLLAQEVQSAFSVVTSIEKPMTGMLLGCAYELFAMIPCAVAGLSHWDLEILESDRQNRQETRERALSWSPPQHCSQNWATAGKLYQLAILLFLEESEGLCETYGTKTGTCIYVSEFISLLESITVGSEITTTLCWPLAVAGFYAYESQHRQAINKYLTEMVAKYGFGNLTQLKQLLNRLWEEDSGTGAQTGGVMMAMKKQGLNAILLV